MATPNLQHLARKLCKLAPLLAAQAALQEEEEKFFRALDRLLALDPIQEIWVLEEVEAALAEAGGDALDWWYDALEAHASLDTWEDPDGQSHETLLVAIPLVSPAGAAQAGILSQAGAIEVAQVLRGLGLLEEGALMGVCSELIRAEDLLVRTPGEIARARGQFCEQLLDQRVELLTLPPGWAGSGAAQGLEHAGVQLHYVLGLVAAPDVVRALPQGHLENMQEALQWGTLPSLSDALDQAPAWDEELGGALSRELRTGLLLTLGEPQNVFDAREAGVELARGAALVQAMPDKATREAGVLARVTPSIGVHGQAGFQVDWVCAWFGQARSGLFWPVLPEESPDGALELLSENLTNNGIHLEPLFEDDRIIPSPSLRLH